MDARGVSAYPRGLRVAKLAGMGRWLLASAALASAARPELPLRRAHCALRAGLLRRQSA
jgi:hypothetical protein